MEERKTRQAQDAIAASIASGAERVGSALPQSPINRTPGMKHADYGAVAGSPIAIVLHRPGGFSFATHY